jgi:tetratricopeptide (TPR) repeat protein
MLRVPSGAVLAQQTESGTSNEIALLNNLLTRIIARAGGEAVTRVNGLSDSAEAVRAYLVGMRAYREARYSTAFSKLTRALEIDSTFAAAALWRSYASEMTPSSTNILEADVTAWRLRNRLSLRDRLLLASRWSIGPNYPEPSMSSELLQALDTAARANPDRPEAWHGLGSMLLVLGRLASAPNARERAAAALDSALAIDPVFAPSLEIGLWTALELHDSAQIRRIGNRYLARQPEAEAIDLERWLVARALRDSVTMATQRARFADFSDVAVWTMDARDVVEGFSLEDSEHANRVRIASGKATRLWELRHRSSLVRIAALRGKVSEAHALADSLRRRSGVLDKGLAYVLVTLGIADQGYDDVAGEAAQKLRAVADSAHDQQTKANALCYAALWSAHERESNAVTRAIPVIRQSVRGLDPAPFPRVGRFDVCSLLLEAWLERMSGRPTSTPALDRLEALMRGGAGMELPGNLANLMIARWREADGSYASALAATRRRLGGVQHDYFTLIEPAYLSAEGRLAASSGDAAGAIDAYTRFLTMRDRPDPGPTEVEVRRVRDHLAVFSLRAQPRS